MFYVDNAMKEMNNEQFTNKDKEDSILKKLLQIDKRIAVIMVSDLMFSGIDTVRKTNV